MADEILKRDENRVPVQGAVTNDSAQEIRPLKVDPDTGGLIGGGLTIKKTDGISEDLKSVDGALRVVDLTDKELQNAILKELRIISIKLNVMQPYGGPLGLDALGDLKDNKY